MPLILIGIGTRTYTSYYTGTASYQITRDFREVRF
jgi:hypothetical protein